VTDGARISPPPAAAVAAGAYIGRDSSGQPVQTWDVQRCETAAHQARPDFRDVAYDFRCQAHRMQTTLPGDPP